MHGCIVPSGDTLLDYHTSNVLYLIICPKDNLQYLGEAVQEFNGRLNLDQGLADPSKHGHCKDLCDNCNDCRCKGASYHIQLIENLTLIGEPNMGIMDACKNTNNKGKGNRMNIETMSIVSIWFK